MSYPNLTFLLRLVSATFPTVFRLPSTENGILVIKLTYKCNVVLHLQIILLKSLLFGNIN